MTTGLDFLRICSTQLLERYWMGCSFDWIWNTVLVWSKKKMAFKLAVKLYHAKLTLIWYIGLDKLPHPKFAALTVLFTDVIKQNGLTQGPFAEALHAIFVYK